MTQPAAPWNGPVPPITAFDMPNVYSANCVDNRASFVYIAGNSNRRGSHMIKLPQHFCERIEAAMADEKALRDKYRMFLETVHEEHKALSEKTKATWDEIKDFMGLEGDFRYENGRLFPVNVGPDGAPVKLADGATVNVEVAQAQGA